jgi:hypothetical protein
MPVCDIALMRPEGVAAAAREVKRCVRAHRRISTASTYEDAEDAWANFLDCAGKVYTKLRAACHGHPRDWGWFGKKLDERGRDQLLLYIHKARNCDKYRLDNIAEHHVGTRTITLANLGQVHHSGPLILLALPVTDKEGRVYDVPVKHKGLSIQYADAGMISFFASKHLQELVKEAASRLR